MNKTISEIKPDLVVITGDAMSGFAWDGKTPKWQEKHWRVLTQPFTDFQQYYIYVQGNHDTQADLTREELTALDMTHPYSLTEMGPKNISGTTNFVRQVYSSKDENKVVMNLWMLDTNIEGCGWSK